MFVAWLSLSFNFGAFGLLKIKIYFAHGQKKKKKKKKYFSPGKKKKKKKKKK